MANKIFYWLKFKNDFFSSLRIKKLRKDYGDTCLVIYLKLRSGNRRCSGIQRCISNIRRRNGRRDRGRFRKGKRHH